MVDVPLLAMVIASAVSLIVLSPREAQRDTLRTLREYDEVESVHASVHELTADAGSGQMQDGNRG